MAYEDPAADDDDEIGIVCLPEPLCPPEVVQDRLDGKLTDADIIVYITIGHLACARLGIESWGHVARLLNMPTPKLLASLETLTKTGWATWRDPDNYSGLHLLVTKKPVFDVHAALMRLAQLREEG